MPSIINATTTNGLSTSADNSGSLQLATNNGTTAVTIDTSQNVGIGTTTPAFPLDVAGAMRGNSWIGRTNVSTPSGDAAIYRAADNTLAFSTGSTERMRIDSSGNLLVGTTAQQITVNERLSVRGTTTIMSTTTDSSMYVATTGTGSRTYINFGVSSGASSTGTISTNGSTTAYNTTSDYRLKENIAPMTGALDKVAQLKPVTYTWKTDGSDGQGFIAHELQEVVPDCVTGEKDAVNEDGSIKPQGIDTSFLVATLTAAIQELNAKVEAQAVRIAELEGAK